MNIIEYNKRLLESITWSNIKEIEKIFNKMEKHYFIDDYELVEKIDNTKYNDPTISYFYAWYKDFKEIAEIDIKIKAN